MQGKVQIDYVEALPPELAHLYQSNKGAAREFCSHICRYNKAFAFTSTSGSGHLDGTVFDSHGPPTYKIQGETFHQIGPLLPESTGAPLYSQLYIYDPTDALQHHNNNNRDTSPATMEHLQNLLQHIHPFIEVYRQAYKLVQRLTLPDYHLQLDFLKATDWCWYNMPTVGHELAAIVPGDVNRCVNLRDIIVRHQGGPLQQLTEIHPAYIALHFPLLAPTRQLG